MLSLSVDLVPVLLLILLLAVLMVFLVQLLIILFIIMAWVKPLIQEMRSAVEEVQGGVAQ